ncbi:MULTISPECIES: PEP-CTERM sorting domain-containing protein [unclassified Microcystis]
MRGAASTPVPESAAILGTLTVLSFGVKLKRKGKNEAHQ